MENLIALLSRERCSRSKLLLRTALNQIQSRLVYLQNIQHYRLLVVVRSQRIIENHTTGFILCHFWLQPHSPPFIYKQSSVYGCVDFKYTSSQLGYDILAAVNIRWLPSYMCCRVVWQTFRSYSLPFSSGLRIRDMGCDVSDMEECGLFGGVRENREKGT